MDKISKFNILEELCNAGDRYRRIKQFFFETQRIARFLIEEIGSFARLWPSADIHDLNQKESLQYVHLMFETFYRMLFNSECIHGFDRVRCFFEVSGEWPVVLFEALLETMCLPLPMPQDFPDNPEIKRLVKDIGSINVAVMFELLQVFDEARRSAVLHHVSAIPSLLTEFHGDKITLVTRSTHMLMATIELLLQLMRPSFNGADLVKLHQHSYVLLHICINNDTILHHLAQEHTEELRYILDDSRDNVVLDTLSRRALGENAKQHLHVIVKRCKEIPKHRHDAVMANSVADPVQTPSSLMHPATTPKSRGISPPRQDIRSQVGSPNPRVGFRPLSPELRDSLVSASASLGGDSFLVARRGVPMLQVRTSTGTLPAGQGRPDPLPLSPSQFSSVLTWSLSLVSVVSVLFRCCLDVLCRGVCPVWQYSLQL